MTTLYEIREQIKELYRKYDIYAKTIGKFVLGLVCFFMINAKIGYMKQLTMFAIPLLLSLICSFLPLNCMVAFAAVIIIAHLFALSMELAAVGAAMLMVMLFLYFVMTPKHGYLLLLTPLLFALKIPYAVPLVVGLVETPLCAVPVGCGVAAYYIIHFASVNQAAFSGNSSEAIAERIQFITEYMIANKEMMLTIIAFAIVICVVYILRRTELDYCWYIAIGAGALTNLLIFLIGSFVFDVSSSIIGLFFGTIVSVAVAVAVQFFVFSVDYTGTRKLQFEDDEYYYYVKAVPKIVISAKDKQIKEIHSSARRKASEGARTRKASVHKESRRNKK